MARREDVDKIITTEELVIEMKNAYIRQHENKVFGRNSNVLRGTSPNIASEFEIALGGLIGNVAQDKYIVLVSYSLTLTLPKKISISI